MSCLEALQCGVIKDGQDTSRQTTQKVWCLGLLLFFFPFSTLRRTSGAAWSVSWLQCGHLYKTQNKSTTPCLCKSDITTVVNNNQKKIVLSDLGIKFAGWKKIRDDIRVDRMCPTRCELSWEYLCTSVMSFNNTEDPNDTAFSDKRCRFGFLTKKDEMLFPGEARPLLLVQTHQWTWKIARWFISWWENCRPYKTVCFCLGLCFFTCSMYPCQSFDVTYPSSTLV